jgi:hypothetical protein
MRALILIPIMAMSFIAATASAADYLSDYKEVHELLNDSRLEGIYLRTNTPYSLSFLIDGTVVNQKGERGRWWVNQQGQYCRVWATGRLKGNLACLDLAREGEQIAIYSKEKKVAEGVLIRD